MDLRQAARELYGLSPQERLELRDRVLMFLRARSDEPAIRDSIRRLANTSLEYPEPVEQLLVELDEQLCSLRR
ncbi:MAG TPA: hypothetical protein VE261_02120 [Gaiellaceae bacterium]|jgi:hypothetical protein|nr:hypothetical protein [Gaiellaceae bacterium]